MIFVAHEIVSIHAPAGGATLGKTVVTLTALFQSTLPRGERPEHYLSGPYAVGVSIHAPAGGATYIELAMDEEKMFQSTLPRGERHRISTLYKS